jgi:DNA-binding transcriptional MerR regulator
MADPLSTSEMSEKYGVTTRRIRFYRDRNVMRAAHLPTHDTYDQVEEQKFRLVRACTDMGLTIKEAMARRSSDGLSVELPVGFAAAKLAAAEAAILKAATAAMLLNDLIDGAPPNALSIRVRSVADYPS